MTSTNPLLDFARKVELSIKLPSNGNWYEEGTIDYTLGGEVEVYPMLPKDELALMNPASIPTSTESFGNEDEVGAKENSFGSTSIWDEEE
jgi:hypothetical protein